MKVFFVAFLLSTTLLQINGLKVLGVFAWVQSSHFAIGNGIVKSLHEAGHDITVISSYPQKNLLENFRDISTAEFITKEKPNVFAIRNMPFMVMIGALLFMGNEVVNSYMTHAGVQNLMNSNEKFDVCIIEIFQEDALVGLADHLYNLWGCQMDQRKDWQV